MLFIRLNVLLYGHAHGRCLRGRSHNVNTELGIFNRFGSGLTKCCNTCFILLEEWEILEQRLNVRWREKHQHIIFHICQVR